MSDKRYKRFYVSESENQLTIYDNEGLDDYYHLGDDERDVKCVCDLLNTLHQENQQLKHYKLYEDNKRLQTIIADLKEENEQLKNELRKEKSLREYSDSMYDVDLIVNIRFSNGEWKADVSVIDDE